MAPKENPSPQEVSKKAKTKAELNQEYLRTLKKEEILSSLSEYSGGVLRP